MLLSVVAALALAQAPGTCRIRSATGVAFGAYDPVGLQASAPLDATGQLAYSCGTGARPLVSLSTGGSGGFAPRTMRGGASTLPYNLYRDAARTQVWGDGTSGTWTVLGPPGKRQVLVIYGRVPPALVARPGGYADTITATFNF